MASFYVGIGFSQTKSTDSIAGGVQNKKDTVPYATLIFYRSYIPKMNAPLKKVPIIDIKNNSIWKEKIK